MKKQPMDEFLEELCSSEKERKELQEVAFLLHEMKEERPSSSFQASLKKKLMAQARLQSGQAGTTAKDHGHAEEGSAVPTIFEHKEHTRWKRFKPIMAAAAAVMLVLVLYFSFGPQNWRAGVADSDEPTDRFFVFRNFHRLPERITPAESDNRDVLAEEPRDEQERETDPSEGYLEVDGEQASDADQPSDPGADTGTPEESEEQDAVIAEEPPLQPDDSQDLEEVEKPSEGEDTRGDSGKEEDPISPEPEFDIWEKEHVVRLAGAVDLPKLYYGQVDDEREPVENIEYSWKPGIIAEASVSSDTLGSEEWARKTLSDEGFPVSSNDRLEINQQVTQKGTYLEIVFLPRRSASLPMVVYYQEDRGIIGYYYEEKGGTFQAGYYPILSPSRAFEQIKDIPVYSDQQRLDFSFRKVSLEYHEFVIKENGEQQLTRLPAYRFTGVESSQGGSEIHVYLPAVSIP